MMIVNLLPNDVLADCRRALHLPTTVGAPIDDALLAALLRHSAGRRCPCSRATLRASLVESLQGLELDTKHLSDRIEEVIEGLIVGGDLLELSDVTTDDPGAKGTWVYAGPPSFVVRRSRNIFLTGVVPDQETFLPRGLASRVAYEGFTRLIAQRPGEDLPAELREQGLQEVSEFVWLRCPKAESANEVLAELEYRLASQPRSGTIHDLQILDAALPVTYYRGRWTTPKRHSGIFIARRPQEFGAPLWCVVSLRDGVPIRLIDLPLKQARWRGCDYAWYTQMAIDRQRAQPQLYRRWIVDDGVQLDFFSPLPLWAERRLMILGRRVPPKKCLVSYQLPSSEAKFEERFLQDQIWLSPVEGITDGDVNADNP